MTAVDVALGGDRRAGSGDRGRRPRPVRARRAARARTVVVSAWLAAVTLAVFVASLALGEFPLPLGDVAAYALGRGTDDADLIVGTLRLPRAVTALLAGAALGLSGAVFQGLSRNPLASPDIIGVTAGAGTAAVLVIVLATDSPVGVPLSAFAGALATATAIYLLAYRDGLSPYRLVLVGIGIGAMLTSATSFLLTRGEIQNVQQAMVWLTGSLNGRGWEHAAQVGAGLVVLCPALLFLARPLRVLQLGDDTARGLGLRVETSRGGLLVVGVGLAAVAVAAAGPVAFVAFVAAPIARRLVRAPVTLLPAALVGALLLLGADLVARTAFAPLELPVGILTALVGAPYLLWLLTVSRRGHRGG